MRNVSPTHIKILHVQAGNLADADAQAEASFLEWSKGHPGVNICQVDRACVIDRQRNERQGEHDLTIVDHPTRRNVLCIRIKLETIFHVSITIMYDLAHEADAVAILMHDLDTAMGAWAGWLDAVKTIEVDGKQPTIVDMQVRLAQPLSKLSASWQQFRTW